MSRPPARRRAKKGFTLLEVMIAMAILILALTALFGHEGVAIQMSDYSNKMSQAVLLGQGKMLDVEHKMLKDSIDIYDDCEDGDFRDVEMRRFKWKACAYKLEIDDGATELMTEQLMAMLAADGGVDPSMMQAAAANGPQEQLGQIAGGIFAMIGAVPIFLQQLEDKVRKVRVEVTWRDAVDERVLVLERYITNLGFGTPINPPGPQPEL